MDNARVAHASIKIVDTVTYWLYDTRARELMLLECISIPLMTGIGASESRF